MAATLSAEEEQVGLDTYFVLVLCSPVRSFHVHIEVEKHVRHRGSTWRHSRRVARTEAIRRWRCAMDLLRNGPREPRAEMLDRFLALVAMLALVAPPPVPLSAGPGLAWVAGGFTSIEPPQT